MWKVGLKVVHIEHWVQTKEWWNTELEGIVPNCFADGVWPIVGISPCYRGENGSLLSIRHKGRFLLVEKLKGKMECKEQ